MCEGHEVETLRQLITSIEGLKDKAETSPEFRSWRKNVEIVIAKCAGADSHYMREFTGISFPRVLQ